MQRPILRGAAGNAGLIFHIFAQDSASTTGAGKASVAFGSWSCRYIRNGEAISGAITPEDITTIGTYAAPTANTNIRIKAVDNTNMIGIYEVQIHADWVNATNACQALTIYLTASGVAVLPIQIPLVAYNPQDAVRLGITALPNAAAEAAGGLYTRGSGAGQINQQANGQVDVNAERLNNVAQSLADLKDFADDGYDPATNKVQGVVLTDTATALTNLPSIPANWITAAGITDGALTAAKFAAAAFDAVWSVTTRLLTAGTNVVDTLEARLTSARAELLDQLDPAVGGTAAAEVDILKEALVIRRNTAQAGANGSITLDASASAVDDFYKNALVVIVSGTGVGQARTISGYTGASKVATITPNWGTNPDATSVFLILPAGVIAGASAPTAGEVADAVWDEARSGHVGVGTFGEAAGLLSDGTVGLAALEALVDDLESRLTAPRAAALDEITAARLSELDAGSAGKMAADIDIVKEAAVIRRATAQAGAAGTIDLDASASASDDFYNDAWLVLVAGTGAGQVRLISDYVGSSKRASVSPNWVTTPDATSVFIVIPAARIDLALWLGSAVNVLISGRVDATAQVVGDKTGYGLASNAVDAGQFTQAAADKVWTSAARTLTSLGASLVQEIWDRATSALTTAGSIGKLLVDRIDALISSRSSHTAADVWTSPTRRLSDATNITSTGGTTVPQTGDGFARLGAPAGASVSADVAAVKTDTAAVKAKTDNLPEGFKRNTAYTNFMLVMVDAADHVTPKTGLTVTAERSIDGGVFAACANAVTELSNGVYKIDLAAADLNGTHFVTLKFTATGADVTLLELRLVP